MQFDHSSINYPPQHTYIDHLGLVRSMTPRKPNHPTLRNANGGWYQRGVMFTMPKKLEIGYEYLDLCIEMWPSRPTQREVAENSKISTKIARKVIMELENTGSLQDPDLIKSDKMRTREKNYYLEPCEELFLLSLRAENPGRPNRDYVVHLYKFYGTIISTSFVSKWFEKRLTYKGSFRKPNLVPIDKFKRENVIRFIEYKLKCELLFDHSRFCFIDEKHLVNKDSVPKKLRGCPLTGRMDFIPVSGDFRESYNMIACISANPLKQKHCVYAIGKKNGSAEAFLDFCHMMIFSGWLRHDEIIVMDNAAIHTGGDCRDIEEFFWDTVVDNKPLHVLVIYLPTRSPELNPIELIFHIFSKRVVSYRLRENAGPVDRAIIRYGTKVLDEISYETILRCYQHCGY
jgi:transposase